MHFADFDGDGKCDILLVDKGNGRTRLIRNNYQNGNWAFQDLGLVSAAAACSQGYGYDLHDNGVRWHDLDGDGKLD